MEQTHLFSILNFAFDRRGSWKITEIRPRNESASPNTASGSEYALHGNHPFAPVSGLLENHPLRDEYLEALGITE